MAESQDTAREIDTSRPHSARVYDYMIGGKNHFEADRVAARKVLEALPTGNIGPRENRGFLSRAVRYLTAEAGVRQFLDIGAGLPTTNNVHEVAQGVLPAAHIVYVDNARSSSFTPGRCSRRPRRAVPRTSRRTCGTPRRSSATR